jgi:hypothetical protein
VQASDPRTGAARRRYRARAARGRGPCWICGEAIDYTLRFPHPRSFSAHHVQSIGRGGHVDGRTVPTHLRCNQQLGDRELVDRTSRDW